MICGMLHILFLIILGRLSVSIVCGVVEEFDPDNYENVEKAYRITTDFSNIETTSKEVSDVLQEMQSIKPYLIFCLMIPFVFLIIMSV